MGIDQTERTGFNFSYFHLIRWKLVSNSNGCALFLRRNTKQVEQQSFYYYIYIRTQTSATSVAPSKYFLNQAEPMKKQMFDEMYMVPRNPLAAFRFNQLHRRIILNQMWS